jgi:hypothetical protein
MDFQPLIWRGERVLDQLVRLESVGARSAGLDLAAEVLHGDFEAENPLGFYDITPDRQPA